MNAQDSEAIGDVPFGFGANASNRSAAYIQVESTRMLAPLLLLALLSCLISGVALGFAMWSKAESSRAQVRADVLQYEVESFKNVLHAHKLPTAEHLPGESP